MQHQTTPREPAIDTHPSVAEWDAFVQAAPLGHFLQASAWATIRAGQGWAVRRVALRDPDGGSILQGAQVLVRGRWGLRMAYVPRGPVVESDGVLSPSLMAAIDALTADCIFVRFEPPWEDRPEARQLLSGFGLRPAEAVQPASTVMLDLRGGPEVLLAGMKQKWRYNIRLAERRGVQVSQEHAEDGWTDFESLVHHTAQRNGFGARPLGYYRSVGRAFGSAAHLYVARLDGQALAGILVLHHGRQATYLYGGSSDLHRDAMPNHLLQWQAIQDAARAGLDRYDFWGIPDALGLAAVEGRDLDAVSAPQTETGQQAGLWGVWGFKRGFGGRVWRAVGAWDRVHAPLRYALALQVLPRLRRFVRRR